MKKILMATLVLCVVACGDIEEKKKVKPIVCVENSCSVSADCASDELCESEICVGFSCATSSDCQTNQICWKEVCKKVDECSGG